MCPAVCVLPKRTSSVVRYTVILLIQRCIFSWLTALGICPPLRHGNYDRKRLWNRVSPIPIYKVTRQHKQNIRVHKLSNTVVHSPSDVDVSVSPSPQMTPDVECKCKWHHWSRRLVCTAFFLSYVFVLFSDVIRVVWTGCVLSSCSFGL